MEEGEGEGLTPPGLPVVLNLAGRLVVVVGGGAVGARKAAAARAAGATLRVVDPALANPDREGGGGAQAHPSADTETAVQLEMLCSHPLPHGRGSPEIIPEPYRPEHLDGAFLVFACATPEVNARVVADARARNILVNSATDPADCDFTLPSVVRSGGLTLAVSTGGAAPALARRIREKLEAEFDATFAEWVAVLAEVRAVVLAEVADPARRRELLDAFADWPWLLRLRADGADAVRSAMLALVPRSR